MSWSWLLVFVLAPLAGSLQPGDDTRRFPEFEVGGLNFQGSWQKASFVAVGEVINHRVYEVQWKEELPWPVPSSLHLLYWCRGDLRIDAAVKGEAPAESVDVYWATVQPDCRSAFNDERYSRQWPTKIWCVKRDGRFQVLLHAFYYRRYLGLPFRWDAGAKLPPRERLGALLLSPSDDEEDLYSFGDRIWERADVACELLGKEGCVRKLRDLAALGGKTPGGEALKEAACQYLKAELREKCDP